MYTCVKRKSVSKNRIPFPSPPTTHYYCYYYSLFSGHISPRLLSMFIFFLRATWGRKSLAVTGRIPSRRRVYIVCMYVHALRLSGQSRREVGRCWVKNACIISLSMPHIYMFFPEYMHSIQIHTSMHAFLYFPMCLCPFFFSNTFLSHIFSGVG